MWKWLSLTLAAVVAGEARAACPSAEPVLSTLACGASVSGQVLSTDSNNISDLNETGEEYVCDDGASEGADSMENLHDFVCPATGTVTILITDLDCDLDFFVLESSCDPFTGCVAGSVDLGFGDDSFGFTCTSGQTYYLTVEGWGFGINPAAPSYCSSTEGNYTITIDATGACSEDCTNAVDDDGDGDIDCDDTDCVDAAECITDADGDGYDGISDGGTDCNDNSAAINPGATEVCDSIDNDCDGSTDEAGASGAPTWYRDADGDSYGSASVTTATCTQPTGYVSNSTDCDDSRAAVYPGATETCDSIDNDCDGATDETGGSTWYRDADGDGYGTTTTTTVSCSAPTGYVSNSTDCNDGNAAVSPADTEVCNSVDDDCDGSTDESGGSTWYADTDEDGYGDSSSTRTSCSQPSGYVSTTGDCNDRSSTTHPNATEYCNSADDDCDGSTDESGAADESTWYEDDDGDGYGSSSVTTRACDQPTGYVDEGTDCNDTSATVYPGASEICDGVDNDCDSRVDESGGSTWYADTDGDGYGDPGVASVSCTAPSGYVSDRTDCDDDAATVNPGATEYCNDVDDDCDGTTDEDAAVDVTTWFEDADGDSYGNAAVTEVDCENPAGYVANDDDCYDVDSSARPGGTETCDGIDEDCDGRTDEGTSCVDDDGDGYAEDGGDCDDVDAGENPAAAESCDGADEDCDGIVDEGTSCYDDDGDGWTEEDGDCNDGDAAASPGTPEFADNGVDDDCDGSVDGGIYDPDGDGYTDDGGDCVPDNGSAYPGAPEVADGVDNDCDGLVDEGTDVTDDDGDGQTELEGDCNDEDADINTGATEVANGVDDDCDGDVDQGGEFTDDDGDGYSDAAGDCDDLDGAVSPDAAESLNGIDDDCDDAIDEYLDDADADGFTAADGDCDDTEGWMRPGLSETCDGLDNDCNGAIDDNCSDGSVGKGDIGGCGCGSDAAGVFLIFGLGSLFARRR